MSWAHDETALLRCAFKRQIKRLNRCYRRIKNDIQPIFEQLESGEILGDKIQGVGYPLYKIRVKNSDSKRGKSGGYRIIYYLVSGEEITLITIYSKSDQSDIETAEILDIIQQE